MMNHSRLVTAFATLAALATVAPATAQEVHLLARVPFAFSVGDANLPGDTYRLTRMNGHPDRLFLRGDRTGTFVQTDEVRVPRDGATPSLVFHRYGDQYFLREIRWEGRTRFDVSETKAEREAAEGRRHRAAALMETVIVTADRR